MQPLKPKLEIIPSDSHKGRLSSFDAFNEDRVQRDLARFAEAPGLFAQYVERARSRFHKAGERAILEHWISFYEAGNRLIAARTEMERKRSEYLQLSHEHDVKLAEKNTNLSKLAADTKEHNLRHDFAEYKRHHLERFVEGGHVATSPESQPKISPEQKRSQDKKNCEARITELKLEKFQALKLTDEDERVHRVNAIDNAIQREYDRWGKLL